MKSIIMILERMGGADQQATSPIGDERIKIREITYPSIWRCLCKARFQQIPPLVLKIISFQSKT
jgi:hypothetical protein